MEQLKENPASQSKSQVNSRFWFYPVLPSVSVRQDVVAMKGLQVGVFTEVLSAEINGTKIEDLTNYKDEANDWFAQAISSRFEELGHVHPSFSRVQGLDELVAMSKDIEQMENPPGFEWWFERYQVKKVVTPRELKVLRRKENYSVPYSGGYLKGSNEVFGGVRLMAIALRLQSGDVTALKVVGEWLIPTSRELLTMEDITPLFTQARFLQDHGRYAAAITLYGKIQDLKPDWDMMHNNRGVAYQDDGQYDKAIVDYDQAIAINPRYAMAYSNRGAVYAHKGQYDRAIADYDHAIAINPRYAMAYSNRGLTYNNKGQYDKAIADYDQAIAINPMLAEAYSNRGVTYYNKGQYDKAIADYTQAIAINPRYAKAYNNRGVAYMVKLGNKIKACADFKRACELGKCINYTIAKGRGGCQ